MAFVCQVQGASCETGNSSTTKLPIRRSSTHRAGLLLSGWLPPPSMLLLLLPAIMPRLLPWPPLPPPPMPAHSARLDHCAIHKLRALQYKLLTLNYGSIEMLAARFAAMPRASAFERLPARRTCALCAFARSLARSLAQETLRFTSHCARHPMRGNCMKRMAHGARRLLAHPSAPWPRARSHATLCGAN